MTKFTNVADLINIDMFVESKAG